MKIKPIITGAGVLIMAGAVVASAFILPQKHVDAVSAPEYIPTDQTFSLACTGGANRTVTEGVSVTKESETISGSGFVFVDGAHWFDIATKSDADSRTILPTASSDLGVTQATGVVYARGASAENGHIMGASSITIGGGDMRGLAVNPCQWAKQSLWLVGSDSQVGTYNTLAILNPGDNPIAVTIAAFGENGPLDLGSAKRMTIAPKTKISTSLDGLIPQTEHMALHLTSDSGEFSASLQTNALDGFNPQGLSFVTGAAFGENVTIPGVIIPSERTSDGDAESGAGASLRIVNPQNSENQVSVALLGKKEQPLPGADKITVPAQSVLDLTLDGIEPGAYAVQVSSQQPLTASVNMTVAAGDVKDQTWVGAQPQLRAGGAAVYGTAQLVMTASKVTTVDVTGYDFQGATKFQKQLSVNGTQTLELPDTIGYVWISASSPLHAAVYSTAELNKGQGINVTALTARGADAQAVAVMVKP
ncbi:DUF5719 family protein [Arcanobacterium phocae]|uniref:DUF5719 family protein n=1 Tax=Arcanobacterium phocae TaxID=131112 RepID=UPI001C0F2273|nr:DUF5719 family protein [Arcanobacterium phocae]